MAVNVSAMELHDENFMAGLLTVPAETGLDPAVLEIELTESVLMKRVESTAAILQALRERGVHVAVDDFGTGYSSLSYLQKFPIDSLKIDQSFVRQISSEEVDATIVMAMISMARSLRLRVVAEGIETAAQLSFLQDHECDQGQGFYFSHPIPADAFATLLANGISVPSRVKFPLSVAS